jgi:hypothetical protein
MFGQPQTRDYHIRMPMDRWVRTACQASGCENWRHGWETHVDEATPLGRQQAAYIRTQSGRTFTERRTAAGLTVFVFEPGQRCFAEHRTRPARLLVHEGGRTREHVSFADLAEDYTEHTGHLAVQAERG